MKKSKSFSRHQERLLKRWSEEDYPGGAPRFQIMLLAKDVAVFFLIPLCAIFLFKIVETSISEPRKPVARRMIEQNTQPNEKQSQIIQFHPAAGANGKAGGFARRSPGTLIKVKLLNVVETFSAAPVHAQIVDNGLGNEFIGGTVLGDAVPDGSSGRITILFRFVRHPRRPDTAVPVSGRAMSLDGTFGLEAKKKEGFFARAAIRSANSGGSKVEVGNESQDFKTLIARAVAAGLMQEFESEASTAHNRAQVLMLQPLTEFFVELTDYFPGQM